MTDVMEAAVIEAAALIIAAAIPTMVGLMNLKHNVALKEHVQDLTFHLNSRMDEFIESVRQLARAQGRREGVDAERDRPMLKVDKPNG